MEFNSFDDKRNKKEQSTQRRFYTGHISHIGQQNKKTQEGVTSVLKVRSHEPHNF